MKMIQKEETKRNDIFPVTKRQKIIPGNKNVHYKVGDVRSWFR